MYGISTLGAILFLIAYIPELIAHIKSDKITGVSISAYTMIILALICGTITHNYFGNYPIGIENGFNAILCIWILILRIKKK